MTLIIVCVSLWEIPATDCFAQQKTATTLNGIVKDAETDENLRNANVYLSNTTIGTSTDSTGQFTMTTIPPGVFDLVVSLIGYERQIIAIQAISSETLYYNIKLTPILIQTNEIIVTADQPKEWQNNLSKFSTIFLGKSDFTNRCIIVNPEILNFSLLNDTLIAQTNSIVIVDNKALGYRLYIALKEFVWNIDKDYGYYLIYPFFVQMPPKDIKEQTKWENNRQRAYKGSLKNFLHSLVSKDTDADMFTIFSGPLKKLASGEGHRVNPGDINIEPIEGTPLFSLNFPGFLRIEYGKRIGQDYIEGGKYNRRWVRTTGVDDLRSVSIITLKSSLTYIDSLGNLFNPLSIEVSGMWGDKRVSELVPID